MIIRFFGKLRETISPQVEIDVPDPAFTVARLRAYLGEIYPAAAEELASPRVKAAIDDEVVDDETMLDGVQMIDFFPPVSGG